MTETIYPEVMIDLETLSNRPNAVILVLAAIKFNRKDLNLEHTELPTFYKKIDIYSCMQVGCRIDKETHRWWQEQDYRIRKEAFGKPRRKLMKVLQDFARWFEGSTYIWSHGSSFDCVILKEAYEKCGMQAPWEYYNERDTRTLYDIANINNRDLPQDSKHHALHDCQRQIYGVKLALQRLKTRNKRHK